MTKSRQWAIGTALAVVLVLVAGAMLLVQPRRSEAASLKEQTAAQEASNVALNAKIVTLKAQQQDLPRQQARLAQIRQQLPEGPNLPSLVRSLTDIGNATGVDVVALAPANPEALTQPAAAATTTTTGTAQPVTPDSAPVASATVQQIPLKISVIGTYAELTQFLGRVENLQRSMLVGEVTVAEPSASGAASSSSTGELQMDLTVRVFMAPPALATSTEQTPATTDNPAAATESQ